MTFDALPDAGSSQAQIEATLNTLRASDSDGRSTFGERWLNDRGLLIDDGALEVAKAAMLAFFTKNNSHSPVMQLETELVNWLLHLFHAPEGACGHLTSGGSESLLLATAAALAHFKQQQPELNAQPEVIVPINGYPSFEKYSLLLGYSVKRVAIDEHFRADPAAIEAAISDNTFMVLASMGSWSHGACDPISEITAITQHQDIWLHIDACVGGLLAPFAADLGRSPEVFDFSLAGVSSISADLHKYGYSAKGVSSVFYRHRQLAESRVFSFDDWSAGLYRSATLTGTRSGGAIAAAWAVMKFLGRQGYLRRATQIFKARDNIVAVIDELPQLKLLGGADLATIAFTSEQLDTTALAHHLGDSGWSVCQLQNPRGLQLVLGPITDHYLEQFIIDLQRAVADISRQSRPLSPTNALVYSDEIVSGAGSLLAGKD